MSAYKAALFGITLILVLLALDNDLGQGWNTLTVIASGVFLFIALSLP